MKVHFIAVAGSAMHNLAIALKKKGYEVTGSDDEIFSPAKERLEQYGILPDSLGWHEERITQDLDCVILGMHAKEDNPELIKAKELGLKIYSYPEFLYEMSKDKIRIVVGGSHGKTTTTAMILHAFKYAGIETDYMVGAMLKGFEVMVKITPANTDSRPQGCDTNQQCRYMVLEGDEYLTSPIDLRPKFHLYMPDIAIITGIEWDHVNVFPTFENYKKQFEIFTEKISENGTLIYCSEDGNVVDVATHCRSDIKRLPYGVPVHKVENGITYVIYNNKEYRMQIFGNHNLMNMNAAMIACKQAGITEDTFLTSMQTFEGAAKRLEVVKQTNNAIMFKDFAHSPSKLKATVSAVKQQFVDRRLMAVMELHTYSSLTQDFLKQYKGTMELADKAVVYYNHHALELKRLPDLDKQKIYSSFAKDGLVVTDSKEELLRILTNEDYANTCLLMSSSGNFDGLDLNLLAEKVIR
ncbi:MAG: peptidoglycan synthetase [Bacteroidales bacterium]|nr:peptidoglycan synthetase [Bacteroidales bacterium]